jgi:exonuclease V gamma subunit
LAIFSLASSKWEKEDVFAIFNNKQFKEKNGFSNNDILLLEKWIAMANVKWAVDAIQKKAFLEKEHNEDNIELNTWAHGFKRLIYGLSSINDDPLAFGITNLDLADFELIDKFLKTFKALHQTTLTLNQENHSLTSWADIIFSTVNIFLTVKDEEWYRPLKEFISKLNISSSFFENQLLSLKEIIFLLKKHLDKIFTSFQTGGVTFGSFIEGAILEKTYICLIGMNHDFPKENFSSFNIVKEFGKIKEEKQNLFLTSLFMTDNLYISYIGFTEENIKIPPSCLVEKFLSYLDNCYQVNGKKISSFEKLHPSIRCHKSYFTTVNKTFSFHVFNTAKAYLSTDTTPALPPQQTADPQDVSIIELKDLSFFALNPLRFHLKKAYDIYFESKEEINELTLPYIYSYIAKEHTVKNSLENILLAIEKQGAFPEGFWKDIAKKKLKKQLSAIYKNLTKATCVFDIHFHPAYTSFQRKTETLFVAPPIEIALHGKNIKIVGKIENISDQGLLCFNNSCWKNIIKIWPQILLFLHTKSLTKITKPHILFLDDDDIKESSFKNMNTHIQKYLACYLETHTKMPIFINPWIENIILEKEEPNKDVYDRMFSFAYPHYHWTTVAQEGRTIFKEVFAPLNEEFHWYE